MGTPLPPRDHSIPLDEAAAKTRRFREQQQQEGGTRFPVLAYNADAFQRILKQDGCVGIRSYPAQNEDGSFVTVMVGVDAKGNDMVDGALMQWPFWCPPECPDENALNKS